MGFIQRISDALVPRDPKKQAVSQASPFDSIREFDGDGNEFWSARKLKGFMGTPLNHLETLPLTLRNSLGAAIAQGVADGSITLSNAGEKVEALARPMLSMPRALYGNYEVATSVSPTGQKLLGYRPAIGSASGPLKQLHS